MGKRLDYSLYCSFPGSAWERTAREAPPRRTRSQAPPGNALSARLRLARRSGAARRGLTLIEMLLVLALIVVLASFCWPAIHRAFSSQRLKKSADIVRAELCKSRVKAMSNDRVVLFRYEMGGSRYRIDQLNDTTSFENALDGATPDAETLRNNAMPVDSLYKSQEGASINDDYRPGAGEHELPKGIIFRAGEIANDSRAMTAGSNSDVGQVSNLSGAPDMTTNVMWSSPIYFYPDGTSSSARIQICNDRNLVIELMLRGMTGVVKVGDITAAEGMGP
jgi:prepilin-type N-terminal cleavage/methylation domain-containing protein